MGIKNLALVGTHRDYAAHVYEVGNHGSRCGVAQCASAHDAATSYMASILEEWNGLIREVAIRVWPLDEDEGTATIFDAKAIMVPLKDEAGEYDVTIELTEW